MSLTEQAAVRRKWENLPHLAKLIGDNRIENRWYGASSASDNVFDRHHRILEIFALSLDYLESHSAEGVVMNREVFEDFLWLSEMLKDRARELNDCSNRIQGLLSEYRHG